jgi:filamentous hemagglutinin
MTQPSSTSASKVFGETWNSQDYATLNTAWHNLVSNDTSITL